MKTLKQLKKDITTKSRLTLIYSSVNNNPYLNKTRQVKEIHSNFIVLTDGSINSRLDYPTSKELIYKDNEFIILENGSPFLTYRIENLEETEHKEKTTVRQEKILKRLLNVDKRINKIYSINDYQAFTDLSSIVFVKDNKLNVEEEKNAPDTLLKLIEKFNKIDYEKYFNITVEDVIKSFNDNDYLTIIYKEKINITLIKSTFINMCLFLGLTSKSRISISGSLSFDTIKNCNIENYTLTSAIKINNLNNNDYAYLVVSPYIKENTLKID